MKVLMATNYIPSAFNTKNNFHNEGWVTGLQNMMINDENVILHIIYPVYNKNECIKQKKSDSLHCFSYYAGNEYNEKDQKRIIDVVSTYIEENSFDVVHIMGTEFPHSYAIYQACKKNNISDRTVISIQGLVHYCAEHLLTGVPNRYLKGLSITEFYNKFSSLNKSKREMISRGHYENKLLCEAKHVIGRTTWDKRCVMLRNPEVVYHFNNESLRSSFYDGDKWNISSCQKHSIFISQATYPLKGLHHVIPAIALVKKQFPDVCIYIGGKSPINKQKWKLTSYGRYISGLIKKYKLQENIVFCGMLNETQIKKHYLNANVFLSPSNIENSSNSICEAMILGVPVVASNVGGTDSMINNGNDGLLYPLNEPYIMAREICELFSNDSMCCKLSDNAKNTASQRHDREKNYLQLMCIYQSVIQSGCEREK